MIYFNQHTKYNLLITSRFVFKGNEKPQMRPLTLLETEEGLANLDKQLNPINNAKDLAKKAREAAKQTSESAQKRLPKSKENSNEGKELTQKELDAINQQKYKEEEFRMKTNGMNDGKTLNQKAEIIINESEKKMSDYGTLSRSIVIEANNIKQVQDQINDLHAQKAGLEDYLKTGKKDARSQDFILEVEKAANMDKTIGSLSTKQRVELKLAYLNGVLNTLDDDRIARLMNTQLQLQAFSREQAKQELDNLGLTGSPEFRGKIDPSSIAKEALAAKDKPESSEVKLAYFQEIMKNPTKGRIANLVRAVRQFSHDYETSGRNVDAAVKKLQSDPDYGKDASISALADIAKTLNGRITSLNMFNAIKKIVGSQVGTLIDANINKTA